MEKAANTDKDIPIIYWRLCIALRMLNLQEKADPTNEDASILFGKIHKFLELPGPKQFDNTMNKWLSRAVKIHASKIE
jgi:hypothetical protein